MGNFRKFVPGALAVAVLVTAGTPSSAVAGSGGTAAPTGPPPAPTGGGTTYDPSAPQEQGTTTSDGGARSGSGSSSGRRPVLSVFRVGAGRFFDLGRPAAVRFRIDGRGKTVHVKLEIRGAGKRLRLLDLGDRALGRTHTFKLTGREQGLLPEGALQLRLSARDTRGRGLRPSSRASNVDSLGFYYHRFPLAGRFSYGGESARFGAGRDGHSHQGQDLTAPEGTVVVAPRAGVITDVDYQAGGAGYYVVMQAEGENRSYAFMHLREGSTKVSEGQRIATGDRIGDVGNTGRSSGPHLHFEIWDGAWQQGGTPIDPLADLKRWDRWS